MAKNDIHSPSKKSLEEIILELPPEEQIIVKRLRAIILECLPNATEKASFGFPLYTHHRMICFVWPPSIVLGSKRTPKKLKTKGIILGFCQGNLMANEDGSLLAEGRKQGYYMYFKSVHEIEDKQIRALLFEADLIDESFRKKKNDSRNR